MATEEEIKKHWGNTHTYEKRMFSGFGSFINLNDLKKNESIAYGDGETFYWLLTEIQPPEIIEIKLYEFEIETYVHKWINKNKVIVRFGVSITWYYKTTKDTGGNCEYFDCDFYEKEDIVWLCKQWQKENKLK